MTPPADTATDLEWARYFAQAYSDLYTAVDKTNRKILTDDLNTAVIYARYELKNRLEVKPPREAAPLADLLKTPPVRVAWPASSSPLPSNVIKFHRRSARR